MEGGPTSLSFASSALLVGIRAGDSGAVRDALRAGADPRARLARGDVLRVLGEGTHLGSQWWASQTAFPWLYFAGKWGTAEVVTLLLRAGCHHSDSTSLGVTALHMAAQEGKPDVAALLLAAGASAAACDFAGWTALHYCANHRWATWDGTASLANHVRCVELLTSGPLPERHYLALVNALDDDGATAMHSAAQSGRVEMCAALYKQGVPFTGAPRSCTPFHVAACYGRCAVMDAFLQWACPIIRRYLLISRCDRGETPCLAACRNGQPGAVLLLAHRGGAIALASSRLLPAAALCLCSASGQCGPDTVATLLGLGVRRKLWRALHAVREQRRQVALKVKAATDQPPGFVQEAACFELNACACEAMLRQAGRGTPLVWAPHRMRLYPEALRLRCQDLLRLMHGCTHLRQLPAPLREFILEDVFTFEARLACWPGVTPLQWDLITQAQRVMLQTGLEEGALSRGASPDGDGPGSDTEEDSDPEAALVEILQGQHLDTDVESDLEGS
jgi:hypothetical protein